MSSDSKSNKIVQKKASFASGSSRKVANKDLTGEKFRITFGAQELRTKDPRGSGSGRSVQKEKYEKGKSRDTLGNNAQQTYFQNASELYDNQSQTSDPSRKRSANETPSDIESITPRYLKPVQHDFSKQIQVFSKEFQLLTESKEKQKKDNLKKKLTVIKKDADIDSEVAAITGLKKVDKQSHQQFELSEQLNASVTIASLGVSHGIGSSMNQLKISPGRNFVSNSSFSQAFSAEASKDFLLPSIERRAQSIMEINKPLDDKPIYKVQSLLKTRQEIENKIKNKRNESALHSTHRQKEISLMLLDPTKPFKGGKLFDHLAFSPQDTEKNVGDAFYSELELQEERERNGFGKRSRSVVPEQKQLHYENSTDLREAFKQFAKRELPFSHKQGSFPNSTKNSQKALDGLRPPSRLLKGNLIINQGSEVAIQLNEHHSENEDQIEENDPKSHLQFLDKIITDMIVKERKEAKEKAERAPLIKFASRPLGVILDSVQSKSNGSRLDASDLDKLRKGATMPPQVIEEWINQTLCKDADNQNEVHQSDSLPRQFKKKTTAKFAQLMEIDHSSLCKAGMPSEKAAQLLRSLFVHSVGFYKHIKDLVFHVKNKQKVIMNVWRVFYMLLESCQKVEHKLIMIELAEQFELEKYEQEKKWQKQEQIWNDSIISQKGQIHERDLSIIALQEKLAKHQEEYNRLNSTYLILASQNEETLALRMRTEARLKEHFSHSRQLGEDFGNLMKKMQEQEVTVKTSVLKAKELQEIVDRHDEVERENANKILLIDQEMQKYKKENKIYKKTIQNQLAPKKRLADAAARSERKAEYMEKSFEDHERQIDMISRQRDDALSEVQILRNLTYQQRGDVSLFEQKAEESIKKMNEAQTELDKRLVMINNIDQTLEEKDQKIIALKQKVEVWRNERYKFSEEAANLADRLADATKQIEVLKKDLKKQDAAIEQTFRKFHEIELNLEAEIKRNAVLQAQFELSDERFYGLQNGYLADREKEVIKLNLEIDRVKLELRQKQEMKDRDIKILKDQIDDQTKQNNLYDKELKKIRSQNISLEMSFAESKNVNNRMNSQNVDLTGKIKQLERDNVRIKAELGKQIKMTTGEELAGKNIENNRQVLEREKEVLGEDKDVLEKNKDFLIASLKQTIQIYDTRDNQVYEANQMIGEDFRSQALENYLSIDGFRKFISNLQEESVKKTQNNLIEKTQLVRENENLNMWIVDNHSNLIQMENQVKYYKRMFEPLEQRNKLLMFEAKKLKIMLGDEFMDFIEIETQTGTGLQLTDNAAQTDRKEMVNCAVQKNVKAVKQMDNEVQTEEIEIIAAQVTPGLQGKKKKGRLPGHRDSPNSSMLIVINEDQQKDSSVDSKRKSKSTTKRGAKKITPRLLGSNSKKHLEKKKKNQKISPENPNRQQAYPDQVRQNQFQVRMPHNLANNEQESHRIDKSIYSEMQGTKWLNDSVKDQNENQPNILKIIPEMHIEKTVILSKKASKMPSNQNLSPKMIMELTHQSNFSNKSRSAGKERPIYDQPFEPTTLVNLMKGELSTYEKQNIFLKATSTALLSRHESQKTTLRESSMESARLKLIQESMTKDGFVLTNNKLFADGKYSPKGFQPFDPNAIDLVGSNHGVYLYRQMINNVGFRRNQSVGNMHHIPVTLEMHKVDLTENMQFQERLAKNRENVKRYIRIATQK